MELLLYFIAPMLLGLYAQYKVTSTFRRFSEVPSATSMTGAEVARAILDRNGLHDVPVNAVPGELTDHYDPRNRSVNLSAPVYGERSISAVSVAAHEVGHALQHQQSYAPLAARSAVFPVAAFGSNLALPLLLFGGFLAYGGSVFGRTVLLVGIALYGFAVLFQVVTLPVEFNASSRARGQLRDMGMVAQQEATGVAKVLNAAALTYVAAALAALAQLLYFVQMFLASDE